jgi:hypothetical protein
MMCNDFVIVFFMSFMDFLQTVQLSSRERKRNRSVCLFLKVGMFSIHQLKRNVKGIIRDTMKPLSHKIGKMTVS